MDKLGVQIAESRGGETSSHGMEFRQLQDSLENVKDFLEANSNARLTLLDQRVRIEKQRSDYSRHISDAKERLHTLTSRQQLIKELTNNQVKKATASNPTLDKAVDLMRRVAKEAVESNASYAFDFTDKKLQALDDFQQELTNLIAKENDPAVQSFVHNIVSDAIDVRRRLNKLNAGAGDSGGEVSGAAFWDIGDDTGTLCEPESEAAFGS